MAKSLAIAALIVAALCFSSVYADYLYVEGDVYCDTCRVEFPTPLSQPLAGAKVRLECRSRENQTLTYSMEGVTEANGKYVLPVSTEYEHEEDICEIKLVSSPKVECSETFSTSVGIARILLTKNVGVVEPTRYANAIGYKSMVALPECAKILQDMGFVNLDVLA